MFGTLRHDSISNDIVFVNHEYGSSVNKADGFVSSYHVACNKCRAEKLRCSGEVTGCRRCKTSKAKCIYTKNSRGEAARRQRQRQSASDISQRAQEARGQNGRISHDHAKPPDSPFVGGAPSSRAMEDRNDGHSENSSHSLAQLEHDSYLTTAASRNPSLDADSIISDFMQGILPSYDPSGMGDFKSPTAAEFGSSEELMDSESGQFSMAFQERGSESDEDGHRIEGEPYTTGTTLAVLSAPVPSSITTRSFQNLMRDPLLYQTTSPISSPFLAHIPSAPQNLMYGNPGPLTPPSQSCRRQGQPQRQEQHQHQTPFPLPTVASWSHNKAKDTNDNTGGTCLCLQEISALLSSLEYHRSLALTTPLDFILAYHKSALGQLSTLVSCQDCRSRSEFLALLSVVAEKSTALCESMLAVAQQQRETSPISDTPYPKQSPRQRRPQEATATLASPPRSATSTGSKEPLRRAMTAESGLSPSTRHSEVIDEAVHSTNATPGSRKKAILGAYETSSSHEWQLLMKALLSMQISGLCGLLQEIKRLTTRLPDGKGTHLGALVAGTDARVWGLVAKARVGKKAVGFERGPGVRT